MPILSEVRRQAPIPVSLFSGGEFTVAPECGLKGFWNYILTLTAQRLAIDLDEYYINQVDKILAILLAPLRPQAIAVS